MSMSVLLRKWYEGLGGESVGIFVRSEGKPIEFILWALDDSRENQSLMAHIVQLHNATLKQP